jgi:hypothetical protein
MIDRPLVSALRDISRKLVDGDWTEISTRNGKSYYVIGSEAREEDLPAWQGETRQADKRRPWRPSPHGEYVVRSGVAAAKPAELYLMKAQERLEKLGITEAQIRRVLDGNLAEVADWRLVDLGSETWSAFMGFLEALLLVRTARGERSLDDEERREVERDRERIYLLEIAQRYGKLVEQSAKLAPLSFRDAQLEEASRCYLYGFSRAAIVLSATALDSALAKRVAPSELRNQEVEAREKGGGYFVALIEAAVESKLLGQRPRVGELPAHAVAARMVFDNRNAVVHKGLTPDRELSERVLDGARGVIEHLVENDQASQPEQGTAS